MQGFKGLQNLWEAKGTKGSENCLWDLGNEEVQEFQETLINDLRCLH